MSSKSAKSNEDAENDDQPVGSIEYSYIPTIRHGPNEQKALRKLSNQISNGFGGHLLSTNQIKPLIEIIDDNEFNDLKQYTSIYDDVLVDFPRYLAQRDNKYQEDITDLIKKYADNPVKFHRQNKDQNHIPVISGLIDPIDHSGFKQCIEELSSEFDQVCIRFFIPVHKYSTSEEHRSREIVEKLRDDDIVLADVLNIRKLSSGAQQNIEFIKDSLNKQEFYVYNLFEPRGEVNHNYGPVMAKRAEVDGFGDFMLERRFPTDVPKHAFPYISKKIHQYDSSTHAISTAQDSDNYVNALGAMIRNGNLDPDHCPACEELYEEYQTVQSDVDRKDLNAGIVKQARMNHYTYSVLDEEFPTMSSAVDAEEFDQDGYSDLS